MMYRYKIWARINQLQTVNTVIWADNDYQALNIAEAQYGRGMVLGYNRIDE